MRLIDLQGFLGATENLRQVQETLRVIATPSFVTGTAASAAVTVNSLEGLVTSEALTTAAAGIYALVLTNSEITASDMVVVVVGNGTNTQGIPVLSTVTPTAGSATIRVANLHASQALNGTLKIWFRVIKAG